MIKNQGFRRGSYKLFNGPWALPCPFKIYGFLSIKLGDSLGNS